MEWDFRMNSNWKLAVIQKNPAPSWNSSTKSGRRQWKKKARRFSKALKIGYESCTLLPIKRLLQSAFLFLLQANPAMKSAVKTVSNVSRICFVCFVLNNFVPTHNMYARRRDLFRPSKLLYYFASIHVKASCWVTRTIYTYYNIQFETFLVFLDQIPGSV